MFDQNKTGTVGFLFPVSSVKGVFPGDSVSDHLAVGNAPDRFPGGIEVDTAVPKLLDTHRVISAIPFTVVFQQFFGRDVGERVYYFHVLY
jgi:hypothetical protein